MAALTEQQRADIRLYLGWSARFGQFNSQLEMAMDSLETFPEHQAQIFNPVTGDPPGLVPLLKDLDAQLLGAQKRYKADKVGSIELNRGEPAQLRRDGRQLVARLSAILSVPVKVDVFGGVAGSNFVGK